MFDISIIIPIYNVENYIERCLLSVINQIYSKPIECIIVNDCTQDDSMTIIRSIVNNYTGNISFRVVNHEINMGPSAARNTGIKSSRGKYILFIDSDDYLDVNCLEILSKYIAIIPNPDIVLGNSLDMYTKKSFVSDSLPTECFENKQIVKLFFNKAFPVTAWNKLIRKDFIIKNNLYFDEGILFEDVLWSYRASKYMDSYVYVPYITYYYETNPNSIMNNVNKNLDIPAKSWFYIIDYLMEHIDSQFYIETCLYIEDLYFMVLDRLNQVSYISEETLVQLEKSKKKYQKYAKKYWNLYIYSFFLFSPLNNLLKYKFFREKQYILKKLVGMF